MIGMVIGGRYEVLSELEQSPLFASYRAMDRQTGKDVRVKVLEPTYAKEQAFVAALKEHVNRLRSIAHPSLERYLDAVDESGQTALISEYSQSITLDERVKRLASFSVQLAVGTAVSICEALVSVHQAGVVHGDVSGRNVLITPSGSVKLTMAGFWTTYAASSKAGLAMLRGMAPYLAPEVTAGAMPNAASDVYSVGVLIYQMLAGRCPYLGDTTVAIATKHSTAPYPSLRAINSSVPEALDELIKRCLAKSPEARYESMNHLLADLRGVQDALRFGRPLTWPIRKEASEPQPVAPLLEAASNPTKTKVSTKEKPKHNREETDELPRWFTGLVVVFVAGLFAAIGGWVWFNTNQPKLVDMPNIVAKDRMQAAAELDKLGLRLIVEKKQFSEKFPAGVIVSQDPEPGHRKVKQGGIVQVVISNGGKFVEVPDLRGRSQEEAMKLLETLNLGLSDDVERVRDKDLEEGLIVSQIPEPRKKVERESKIRIKVSNGDKRVGDGGASNQKYTYKLKITMPAGAAGILVRIDMTDERETQTIHEEQHEPGESFEIEHDGYGKEVLFRVFFDNEMVKQIEKAAEDADQSREE